MRMRMNSTLFFCAMTHSAIPLQKEAEKKLSAFRLLQTVAFILFGATSIALALDIAEGARTFGKLWMLPVVVIVAYALADLLSGIVHFLADNFGSPDTPLLGKAFVMPFRDHHVDPKGILSHPFMIANGNNCLVALPPLMLVLFFVPVETSFAGYLFGAFSLRSVSQFFSRISFTSGRIWTTHRAQSYGFSRKGLFSRRNIMMCTMKVLSTRTTASPRAGGTLSCSA